MSTIIFFLPFLILYALWVVWFERKLSAIIQDRLGPMETGKWGWLQTVADILKLIQKEDIAATATDKILFKLAPILVFVAVFAGFAVLPVTNSWAGSGANVGVFYLIAIVSLHIVAILMAGWGSNNKYALYGAIRAVAQIVSYEVPLGLTILCVVIISQTLDLQQISFQQGTLLSSVTLGEIERNYLFGIKPWGIDTTEVGGIVTWNIFRAPFLFIAFIIFFIASLAECNRAPFDLPESESELVGGFHTEYGGFKFALIYLAEYGMMLLASLLGVILFLGSWNTPFPNIGLFRLADWTSGMPGTVAGNLWSVFWLITKALLLVCVQVWIRWTYPRLRVDQLMTFCWKYLIPTSLVLVFVAGIWKLWMI